MLIAIHNHKGGTGKSTIAAHLAFRAEQLGIKTLAATIDRQGDLLRWFTRGEALLEVDSPIQYGDHVTALYSPDEFPTRLAAGFPLTIVDTSPHSDVTGGAVSPDLWIVPVDNRTAIENLASVLPMMLKKAPALLVFYMADGGGVGALGALQDAARMLDKIEIYDEVIPKSGAMFRAQLRYCPVWESPFGADSVVHKAIVRFADHVFKRAGVAKTAAPKASARKGGRR